jgi:hypothetical protein
MISHEDLSFVLEIKGEKSWAYKVGNRYFTKGHEYEFEERDLTRACEPQIKERRLIRYDRGDWVGTPVAYESEVKLYLD